MQTKFEGLQAQVERAPKTTKKEETAVSSIGKAYQTRVCVASHLLVQRKQIYFI